MKIGRTSNAITTEERAKIADLPATPNAYLEIPKLATEPTVAPEGECYYNTTEDKFYLSNGTAWVEHLFSMEEILP